MICLIKGIKIQGTLLEGSPCDMLVDITTWISFTVKDARVPFQAYTANSLDYGFVTTFFLLKKL